MKLSTVGAAVGSSLAFADWHGRIEQHLADTGMTAVVLRSSFYMHNLFANADAVRHTGKLFAPADDARIAMIDRRDVAAAAAVLLTDERHHEPTYTISGPAAITYRDVATDLSTATGHNIMFVHIPDEAAHAALRDSGAPPWLADNLVALFRRLREGISSQVTDTVKSLTGHSPRSFAEFACDHAELFRYEGGP